MIWSFNLLAQFTIDGTVSYQSVNPVQAARVTLFNSDTTTFMETRTASNGNFTFTNVVAGNYTLGVAKLNMEYQEITETITGNVVALNFDLDDETEAGNWQEIILSPEPLGGTDLGILLADGRIFYCHDTQDPFLFDPAANDTVLIAGYDSTQGCVGPTMLKDGRVIFIGGTNQQIYGPGNKKVKTYDQNTGVWQPLPNILDYRWYPTVAQFPNGRLLVIGGGGLNNPVRMNTSEVYDPYALTSIAVDDIQIGNEVSPIVLLYTGDVLMTHRPPQLFDIASLQWSTADDFVQGNRMPNGDHSDHELVLLPDDDGRVVAIGFISFSSGFGNMVEIYDPQADNWSFGANFPPIRSRAKTVLLPDRKILVAGGYKEDTTDHSPVNQWGQLKLTDLYDPGQNTWRRLDDLNYAREYHCTTILVPDGRVIAVGGEGQPGNEPSFSVIEAFEPPYLFRGVRPEMHSLSSDDMQRGGSFSFEVEKADSLTSVVLISTAAVTHFMNSGNNRYINLDFTQSGFQVSASVPLDSVTVPYGYYMLFAMVDDIPSVAKMVRISDNIITSVNDQHLDSEFDFLVFPNPTVNEINVRFKEAVAGLVSITVTDSMGKPILTKSEQTEKKLSLPLSGLSNGTYYITVEANGSITTKQFSILE